MNAHRQPQKRPWVIAGLLALALLSTAMAGCDRSTVPSIGDNSTSGTVNSRFVDVNSLLVAPTKVVMSYPTEGVNWDLGGPQFMDGMIYTLSYKETGNGNAWMTAWDQTTGKRLWSVDTGLGWIWSFVSDGTHLFLHTDNTFRCLDKMTGKTLWESTPTIPSPFVLGLNGNMVLHIDKQNDVADRLYVLGAEIRKLDTGSEQRNPGIYILDGADGKLLGHISWPALTLLGGNGELLCDGATLYASMPESTEDGYPVQKSSLVAFDLTTNKILWQEAVDGEGSNFVKQGNIIVFIRSAADDWIDVWQIGDTTASATRLWTRKIEEEQSSAYHTFPFAVNNAFVYLQGKQGALMALDLLNGKKMWSHQFAPIKEPIITDGPDMGKEYDTYQPMTMTTARDALYVEDGGGLLEVFDPATGKELWSKRISHVIQGQKSVVGAYMMQVIDKGIVVMMASGTVSIWQ